MKGRTATAREIKARWAYSEVLSDRFGGPYGMILDRPLLDRIKGGCPFSEIAERYWDLLILGLNTARSSRFSQNIDTCGPNGYVCVEWSVDDLLNSRVLPHFGLGLSYREFLTLLPTSAAGIIDPADPRLKAWMTPLQPAFAQNEPLISIRLGADLMLIEGYARSLLWFRSPTKPLLIWQPVELGDDICPCDHTAIL